MHILLNKMSTKGGRGGQKSLKSCLRSKSMTPNKKPQILFLLKKAKSNNTDTPIMSTFTTVFAIL